MNDFKNNEDWLRSLFAETETDDDASDVPENTDNADTRPLISLTDDNGDEYTFEELDVLYLNNKEYVALLPVADEDSENYFDLEVIYLTRCYSDDEIYLEAIEDSDEFNEIRNIFEERLADLF